MGEAADRADVVVVDFSLFAQVGKSSLVEFLVDLFHLVGVVEGAQGFLVAIGFGIFNESGVHFAVFVVLSSHGSFQVFFSGFHFTGSAQMVVGMYGLGSGSGAEKFGNLWKAVFIGFFGEGKVAAVGL